MRHTFGDLEEVGLDLETVKGDQAQLLCEKFKLGCVDCSGHSSTGI